MQQAMKKKKLNRHRQIMLNGSTAIRYDLKLSARNRRLRLRRLKYSYRTRIRVVDTGGEITDQSNKKGENFSSSDKNGEITESMKVVSLSLVKDDQEDAVSVGFGDEDCKSEKKLTYGMMSVIGGRREMEDAVSVELGLVERDGVRYDFFAVFDGHGGSQVAQACRERLHQLVEEEATRDRMREVGWERMMELCFARMDNEVADNAAVKTVGSTAVVAVVSSSEVVVANCGDSRAVMGRGGEAFALSKDHKPDRPDEEKRIEAAGGKVIDWNGHRVLGVLATSRSIGDQYLRPYVICTPEVTVTDRTNKDEFLILASDGLWDVLSNENACQVVRNCLGRKTNRRPVISEVGDDSGAAAEAEAAAAILTRLAIARGSKDNTSVIVLDLRR